MWMILSSRDRLSRAVTWWGCLVLVAFLFASCHPQEDSMVPREPEHVHDAPRPAKPRADHRPAPIDSSQLRTTVELKSVSIGKLDGRMAELAGARFRKAAADPLVITVQLQHPLDQLPRTSSPVIVFNGKELMNTRGLAEARDRLVAFLPDRSLIRATNTVTVFWIGNKELTMTRRPLMLRAEDVPD